MIRRGYNVVASFDSIPDSPSILDVTPISQIATDDFCLARWIWFLLGTRTLLI